MDDYTTITVEDIVATVKANPQQFPDGMKTIVLSGDFEGNYTHRLHELQHCGRAICLGYEMHEGQN